jgi:hypothetical protein
MITRDLMLQALCDLLEPLDYVHAMWESGSVSFDRTDDWSDIDLSIDIDDDQVANVFAKVEGTLHALSPIELKYEVKMPWHGQWQTVYRLRDAPDFLLLDLNIMQHSNPNTGIQPLLHGMPRVVFDKSGVVYWPPLDIEALLASIQARLEALRTTFRLYQTVVQKYLHRRQPVEAHGYYQTFILGPVLEALRIRYKPVRYNFQSRGIYHDLPAEIIQRVEPLCFVSSEADLRSKLEAAERLFSETIAQIDLEQVRTLLHEHFG